MSKNTIISTILGTIVCFTITCALVLLGFAKPAHAAEQAAATLALAPQTSATITDSSGYKAHITITNSGKTPLDPGQVRILTNPQFIFDSSTVMQEWAQGQQTVRGLKRLDTMLGAADVQELKPGASTTIAITTQPSDPALQLFTSWGAKPVLIQYVGTNAGTISLHTFVTRTLDGLNMSQTPAMNIVPVLPIHARSWDVDEKAMEKVSSADTHAADSSILTISEQERTHHATIVAVAKRHSSLQTLVDPDSTYQFTQPMNYQAVLQPSSTDLAFYAQTTASSANTSGDADNSADSTGSAKADDTQASNTTISNDQWQAAGITAKDFQASTALQTLSENTDTQAENIPAIAWQRQTPWTQPALNFAKEAGYQAVIATSGYRDTTTTAVATSKSTVHTTAGDIALLTPQQELSALAHNDQTDSAAGAEATDAGKINRLLAQSAMYQMQQPYVPRTVLVTFDCNTPASLVDAMMSTMEQASWLHMSTIQDLLHSPDGMDSQQATEQSEDTEELLETMQPSFTALHQQHLQQLKDLAQVSNDITRFTRNILDPAGTESAQASSTQTDSASTSDSASANDSSKSGDASSSGNSGSSSNSDNSDNSSDAHDSSRASDVDAQRTKRTVRLAKQWATTLSGAQHALALRALGVDATNAAPLIQGAQSLSSALFKGVSIAKPEALNIVSQSAKMPITLSNTHPFPVSVRVIANSSTGLIALHASHSANTASGTAGNTSNAGADGAQSAVTDIVTIPAHGEEQITIDVSILQSGRSNVSLALQDRTGEAFGESTHTTVTSWFQIIDWSGYVILGFAVLLGLLGIWRQFHRVKDPDE